MAGNVKAIGVQNRAPVRPRNDPTLVSRIIVNTTVKRTRRNLVKFFDHYLFFVLGHEEYNIFSITICAGYRTKGYEKIKLRQKSTLIV